MLNLLIPALAVTAVFLLSLGVLSLVRASSGAGEERVRERLEALHKAGPGARTADIVRRRQLSDVPWLHRFLARRKWIGGLERLIAQGAAPGRPGVYVLVSALLGFSGVYACTLLTGMFWVAVALGAFLAWTPFMWLKRRKNARMARFEAQLPEALDLIGRALKAGHTFGGGLSMVRDEFEDPIGSEFGKTLDEINFGMDVERALLNLTERVECLDLKFFVVSVNIQRETGGNLAEIVGNIATLIRERFKLMAKVQTLSAEGRLSAAILLILPFGISGVIYLINPDYMSILFTTAIGRKLIVAALASMALGYVIIRKMIRIKV